MAADVVSPIGSMPMVTTKRLEGTLVAPIAHLPVPNYLTDTSKNSWTHRVTIRSQFLAS